jgi:adenylyltransferase/sulfurtransferase
MGFLSSLFGRSSAPEISPRELAEKLRSPKPPRLLDVRNPDEFALVKIEGAKLIPLGELAGRLGELEDWKNEEIVTYCHRGVRSLRAAALLLQHGFTHVASMAGGIDRWAVEVDLKLPRY